MSKRDLYHALKAELETILNWYSDRMVDYSNGNEPEGYDSIMRDIASQLDYVCSKYVGFFGQKNVSAICKEMTGYNYEWGEWER